MCVHNTFQLSDHFKIFRIFVHLSISTEKIFHLDMKFRVNKIFLNQ